MSQNVIFTLMVFISILFFASAFILPSAGADAQSAKRLRKRISTVLNGSEEAGVQSLLREKYLRKLSPFERRIERLPGMEYLAYIIDQSGKQIPAYRLVLFALTLTIAVPLIFNWLQFNMFICTGVAFFAAMSPFGYILLQRNRRIARFESQLPDALDMMSRALQAGHPFNETLKLVGEEMNEPIASEFNQVFSDMNFGVPMKTAFLSLLERVPSVSLNALITAILIQHESGGRMAEIMDKIAHVIRGRFKLQRTVKTLSAEGRMSAIVLIALPFVLAGVISLTEPSYLPRLTNDAFGMKLIYASLVFLLIGILWIRSIIRIKA